jgi:hypothetical protein
MILKRPDDPRHLFLQEELTAKQKRYPLVVRIREDEFRAAVNDRRVILPPAPEAQA